MNGAARHTNDSTRETTMAKTAQKAKPPTPAGQATPDTNEDTVDTRSPAARHMAAYRERQRAKGLLPPRKTPPPCGTEAKARWHMRHDEVVCDACRDAVNEAQRRRYALARGITPEHLIAREPATSPRKK